MAINQYIKALMHGKTNKHKVPKCHDYNVVVLEIHKTWLFGSQGNVSPALSKPIFSRCQQKAMNDALSTVSEARKATHSSPYEVVIQKEAKRNKAAPETGV